MNRLLLLVTSCLVGSSPAEATDFSQVAKFNGSQVAANDQFGTSCATDGTTTVVGAPRRLDPFSGSGAAYVYSGCSGIQEEQRLTAGLDAFSGDGFGHAVAVDGDVVVVGATEGGYDGALNNGAAYVFRRSGSQWLLEQKLTAPDGMPEDAFGLGLDVQGDLIAVGAGNRDDAGAGSVNSGAAYLFRHDGSQWNHEKSLYGQGDRERFGFCLDLDGDRLAVGALFWNFSLFHKNVGRVYTYRQDGSDWVEGGIAALDDWEREDWFGSSVALKGDTLLVGAPGDDDDPASATPERGAAYVFRHDGSSWIETQKIVPAGAIVTDRVGSRVALDGPNSIAVIGNFKDDLAAQDAGSITVYGHDGDEWVERQTLVATDAASEDRLLSVAIAGGVVVAGAYCADDPGMDSGAAYVFSAPVQSFGKGLAGTGGLVPSLDISGDVSVGGSATLEFRDFVGGALCYVLLGHDADELAFRGGTLLLDLGQPFSVFTLTLPGSPGLAGEGDADVPFLITNSPSLNCQSFFLQVWASDAAAIQRVSASQGVMMFTD